LALEIISGSQAQFIIGKDEVSIGDGDNGTGHGDS